MKSGASSPDAVSLLEKAGIRPTSNRLLVVRALMGSDRPQSLVELETALETLERSSILRVLNLLVRSDVVHLFEDGRGVGKYELCPAESHCSVGDMHAHFYCERCERVFCFEEISAPNVSIPLDFHIRSINFMLKGTCPECSNTILNN